jgi:peroxin-5
MCLALTSHSIRVWERLQESGAPPKGEDLAKWESEFHQLMTAQREELEQDCGGVMQDTWESGIGEFTDSATDNRKLDELGYPILTEYVFGESRVVFLRV